MKSIVILGGAFFALGNVNPAAEANVSASLSKIHGCFPKKEIKQTSLVQTVALSCKFGYIVLITHQTYEFITIRISIQSDNSPNTGQQRISLVHTFQSNQVTEN